MVRIKDESNIETLRQLALLQDNENKRLIDKVTKLTIENARLRGLDDTGQLELEIRAELEKLRESILRIDEKKAPPKEKQKKKKRVHQRNHRRKSQRVMVLGLSPSFPPSIESSSLRNLSENATCVVATSRR